jgi:hypothetical protein
MPSWIRRELVTLRKQNGQTQSEWLRFAFGSQVKIDKFPRANNLYQFGCPRVAQSVRGIITQPP